MKRKELTLKINESVLSIDNATVKLYCYKSAEQNGSSLDVSFMHTHSYFEVFLCTGGGIDIEWTSGCCHLSSYEMCVIPPDLLHTKIGSEREYLAFGVSISPGVGDSGHGLFSRLCGLFCVSEPIVIRDRPTYVRELASAVIGLGERESFPALLKACELFYKLSERRVGRPHTAAAQNGIKDNTRLVMIEQMINDSFRRDITPEDIARELHLSRRQTERIVKARYGSTLKELLTRRRVEFAARLLSLSKLSADEIALESGFGCKETLVRRFKEHFGTTPSEYRDKNLSKREP